MTSKAIIIGASTSGKSTLMQYLRENTDLLVSEADEMLTAMNGGTYPHDSDYKMNTLAPKMVAQVLQQDHIVFFTNTHYFQPKDLKLACQNGFKIIQLTLEREHMEKRNQHRVENEGYHDLGKHFENMLQYQRDIQAQGLVDTMIDTSQPIEETAKHLLSLLKS